ncbi:MAG: 2-oxoglutarate dehydrogenase complex dihydrolipoyllysine-residue succinyltransferase [Alphaproteobacteria bacterium]|nr:2-oxoglutarate dehydrogenase complex dihydrolipoyllysine-residue succinyltransferase [Alphaproteobacteria bacterium]
MTVEIRVPALGESVSEATVAKWFRTVGDVVTVDEPLVELETDKVTVEVPAASSGTISEIIAAEGDNVEVGALLCAITEGAAPAKTAPAAKAAAAAPAPAEKPAPLAAPVGQAPSVRRLVSEKGIDPATVAGTGKGGRVTKGDMLAQAAGSTAAPRGRREERVRMTRLRKRIAERLKEAQNTAAMLTTFNEVDMTALLKLRADYRDAFEKKHGVRLGFMSFFAKASVIALGELPSVNAEIDGDEIVYKNYCDIGVAVSAPNGLVVPVLRDVEEMSFADIEKTITDFGRRARDGKMTMEDLTGGTFTISNGGVFGSLLSTPILNPPQSAILGMHKIEKRAVVVDDAVVVRPMMYLALSYDHRLVDGREAVTFLVRVKECIEDPQRILLDM